MINLTNSALEAIQKDSEQGVAPGAGDAQLMIAKIRRLTCSGKDLLVERQALAGLLKRFVDGEHEQNENRAERHTRTRTKRRPCGHSWAAIYVDTP